MLTCRNDMLELTKQLVQMESIVNTKGEKAFAESLYDMIMKMPYFKQNPSHVVLAPTVNDERDRYNVMAFVKGTKGKSKQIAILMGHIDTVGINDFNHLKDVAFSPDKLMGHLRNEQLPNRIKEQRSEEHTSELQSRGHLVCRLLLEK